MEHSTALLEDAGRLIDAAARSNAAEAERGEADSRESDSKQNHNGDRKRKGAPLDFQPRHRNQRGGRGGASNDRKRHKKGDMGRGEYFRDAPDKREKTNASREKRLEGKGPTYGTQFSKEEIDAEERRPKRKVAVLIGYSGTGYKGMQISASEKTIEGDLFNAFIAAGAISKANADDPKKASLVRCARTDKGVHAAGNMISLKLIVEDEDIVAKINHHLSPQIRIWGIERTIGSFSCYQACDSRWYEYLIPSHAFLPPHPSSWLAKKLEASADEAGDRIQYESRQAEVNGFWDRVDRDDIEPVLASLDEDIRDDVIKALRGEDETDAHAVTLDAADDNDGVDEGAEKDVSNSTVPEKESHDVSTTETEVPAQPEDDRHLRLRAATKKLRLAYTSAKRRYRIQQQRIDQIQAALNKFIGTSNFHNYTVQKTFNDPSAKRHIKSFVVNKRPVLIGDGPDEEKSEWLSLKIHGQSFMMHQIRKMIGMVTLLVRCGSDLSTLDKSLTPARFSIPKVPGLGLLLERPVFDSYNELQAVKHGREKLDFGKFEKELEEFKQREIYQRIFREEEERNEFGKFFTHVDNFKDSHFLYVTSKGLA